jgi:hypothetical protein
MTKNDFTKVFEYGKSLGLNIKTRYYTHHRNLKEYQAFCQDKKIVIYIRKISWKNNYINWTGATFDLCHEIGHFLYDRNNPAPIMSDRAYGYLPANNNYEYKYIPKQYRPYILKEECGATDFVPAILDKVGIKYSWFRFMCYYFEIMYTYARSCENYGKDPTYKEMRGARREFRRLCKKYRAKHKEKAL